MTRIFLAFILSISTYTIGAAQDWELDLTNAIERASQKKVPIILVFQGSDWCAPCIKLDREVWSTEEFKTYAHNNFIMLQADFPRKKKNTLSKDQQEKNNMLAEKYNYKGVFPLVVVLDAKGEIMGETGYLKMSAAEYIDHLNTLVK